MENNTQSPTEPQVTGQMPENTPESTIELSGGRVAAVQKFKGKHIKQAQRLIGENGEDMMFAIISLLTTIDGNPVVMEDLDEMPGPDLLKLMGHFGAANF